MHLIVFSKKLRERTLPERAQLAHEYGFEGYDLCVRPGYPINAGSDLPAAVAFFQREGLGIPMVTAVFDELARLGYRGPLSVHCEF